MKNQKGNDLFDRTKAFALRIIRLFTSLPNSQLAQVLGKQLLRCGTSVGAQYREVNRARTTAEFISKMESALQELSESIYWLELLSDSSVVKPARLVALRKEADELTAIFVASINTAKSRR